MPTLLKNVNLFIITAYNPLIMKWGVPLIWDFTVGHFWSICPKMMIFAKNKEKAEAYCMHYLLKADNPFNKTDFYMPLIVKWSVVKAKTWF